MHRHITVAVVTFIAASTTAITTTTWSGPASAANCGKPAPNSTRGSPF